MRGSSCPREDQKGLLHKVSLKTQMKQDCYEEWLPCQPMNQQIIPLDNKILEYFLKPTHEIALYIALQVYCLIIWRVSFDARAWFGDIFVFNFPTPGKIKGPFHTFFRWELYESITESNHTQLLEVVICLPTIQPSNKRTSNPVLKTFNTSCG